MEGDQKDSACKSFHSEKDFEHRSEDPKKVTRILPCKRSFERLFDDRGFELEDRLKKYGSVRPKELPTELCNFCMVRNDAKYDLKRVARSLCSRRCGHGGLPSVQLKGF